MKRYTYKLPDTKNHKTGKNLEVEIEYTHHKAFAGRALSGPMDGAEPPEPEHVEIETITLNGHDVSEWFDSGFTTNLEEVAAEILTSL